MKIDRRTLALTIASLCGTCGVSSAQQDASLLSIAESGHSRPTAGLATQASHTTLLAANEKARGLPAPTGYAGHISDDSMEDSYDGTATTLPGSVAGFSSSSASCSSPCESQASTSCGSGASAIRVLDCGPSMGWMDFDTLLWWGRGLTNSPVVLQGVGNAAPNTPILGGADHPIGTDLMFGLRTDVGFWLDDCQDYGVGGRAWGILSNAQEKVINGGNNSTGVQFYDAANFGVSNSLWVNNNLGSTGTIGVLSDLDVFSGELYLRSRLIGDRSNRTDLLTGYTFLRLDSEYRLFANINNGATTVLDRFTTYNTFHGGHLGLSNNVTRGRVGFNLTGRVALGNMESTSFSFGSATPPVPPTRGLFAQASNSGRITRNNFTFIPEMNAKMRYRLGRADLGVGYSMVVLPDVAMAASQIDHYVETPAVNGSVSPHPKFNTEAYFLHGLDLGLTFRF